jgi:TatD DNase family protein
MSETGEAEGPEDEELAATKAAAPEKLRVETSYIVTIARETTSPRRGTQQPVEIATVPAYIPSVMLVDSHCHLDYADYGSDREDVLRRARLAGVGAMLTISTKLSGFPAVRAVAERHPDIWCSVGVHPHEAAAEGPDADTAKLVALATHPRVVGIGETGLDYYYEHAPRQAQIDSFRAHIAAARETGLPLIVHTRDADEDTAAILAAEQGKGAFCGLLHCFSSGAPLAEAALAQGLYISFSVFLTFYIESGLSFLY